MAENKSGVLIFPIKLGITIADASKNPDAMTTLALRIESARPAATVNQKNVNIFTLSWFYNA